MTKVKNLVILFVAAVLILIMPNIANAATEYTYSDTEQGIEWIYELDKNENIINLRCTTTTKTGEVAIPSTIDGKTVIALADDSYSTGAFQDCAGITSVTIPNTITTIGVSAFKNCSGLRTITIPDSVTTIQDNAFYGCSGLTSITLSENLTTIGADAFSRSGLRTITIPNTVSSIGAEAFAYCSGLSEVNLSENLTVINGGTFRECSALKTIIIPDNVTTIKYGGIVDGYGAFRDCNNLEKILIPDNVVSIDDKVFEGCDKLTIYGNEGMTSKEYAETNEINFKTIAEWDDSNVGDDVTPPTVEKIEITSDSLNGVEEDDGMFMLPTGTRIVINVYFNEALHGTTAPTLIIKCGQGSSIELTDGTISATHIIYTYTIKEGDIGIITAVDLTGGNVTDAAGNAARLSVTDLTIEDWWNSDKYAYANGIISNPGGDGDNGDDGSGSGSGTGEGSGSNEGDGSDKGTETVSVESVSLNQTKLNLEKGKTYTLIATVKPNNATNTAITFKSSNESVAKVDAKGVITAVGKGTATITVTTADGQKTAKCEVTVTEVTEKADGTEATGKIPHAGLNAGIIVAIIATIVACAVVYSRYNKMRDI